jgi:hypothetical protein
MFRRCYALEKVHGTSAHVFYDVARSPAARAVTFFSGGEKHDRFVALFDYDDLYRRFSELGHAAVTVYGEAYGGKQQGMRNTYGDELRFIAFDVKIGNTWLAVPDAAQVVDALKLEMVPYSELSTDLDELNRARDAFSVVAERRGCGTDKPREGIVLRPLVEMTLNNGDRVICKHKGAAFDERKTPQTVADPARLAVLADAQEIAQEWVTPMRLSHVLDKLPQPYVVTQTALVIKAMIEDVYREAAGEVVESREATAAIGKRTSALFHERLRSSLRPNADA